MTLTWFDVLVIFPACAVEFALGWYLGVERERAKRRDLP